MLGVRIAAPEQVFEPAGARGALEAYLRLCADPTNADAEDVARVCRAPGRGLPLDAEQQVAASLKAGRSFTESFATVATRRSTAARDSMRPASSWMRLPGLRTPAGSSGTCVAPAGSTTISESTSALSEAPSGSRSRCSSRRAARRRAGPSPSTPRCCNPAATPSRAIRDDERRHRAHDDSSGEGPSVAGGARLRLRRRPATACPFARGEPAGTRGRRGHRGGTAARIRGFHPGPVRADAALRPPERRAVS